MQTVILAGGLGTRLAEETGLRPKPMVEIGDRPMLRHIMELYEHDGFTNFVVALGYLGHMIKRYFVDFMTLSGDIEVDLAEGRLDRVGKPPLSWRMSLVETGRTTETGGRLARCAPFLKGERFMLTYGDGVANIDLRALVAFHQSHGKLATVSAVRPPARFGEIDLEGNRVASFAEKPHVRQGWINGGFMVMERAVLERISGDSCVLERDVLTPLADEGQLMAYKHDGFWHCMDTLRDVRTLNEMWSTGAAPWRRSK